MDIGESFAKNSKIKGIGTNGPYTKAIKMGYVENRYFFSHRVVIRWNVLDQQTVDAPSINAFNGRLAELTQTRLGFFMD